MDVDDFDLYGDLDNALTEPLQEEIDKKAAEELAKIQDDKKFREETEKRINTLQTSNQQMRKNMHILLETARAEVERKDNQIRDLRKEMDALIFRKTKVNKNKTFDKWSQTDFNDDVNEKYHGSRHDYKERNFDSRRERDSRSSRYENSRSRHSPERFSSRNDESSRYKSKSDYQRSSRDKSRDNASKVSRHGSREKEAKSSRSKERDCKSHQKTQSSSEKDVKKQEFKTLQEQAKIHNRKNLKIKEDGSKDQDSSEDRKRSKSPHITNKKRSRSKESEINFNERDFKSHQKIQSSSEKDMKEQEPKTLKEQAKIYNKKRHCNDKNLKIKEECVNLLEKIEKKAVSPRKSMKEKEKEVNIKEEIVENSPIKVEEVVNINIINKKNEISSVASTKITAISDINENPQNQTSVSTIGNSTNVPVLNDEHSSSTSFKHLPNLNDICDSTSKSLKISTDRRSKNKNVEKVDDLRTHILRHRAVKEESKCREEEKRKNEENQKQREEMKKKSKEKKSSPRKSKKEQEKDDKSKELKVILQKKVPADSKSKDEDAKLKDGDAKLKAKGKETIKESTRNKNDEIRLHSSSNVIDESIDCVEESALNNENITIINYESISVSEKDENSENQDKIYLVGSEEVITNNYKYVKILVESEVMVKLNSMHKELKNADHEQLKSSVCEIVPMETSAVIENSPREANHEEVSILMEAKQANENGLNSTSSTSKGSPENDSFDSLNNSTGSEKSKKRKRKIVTTEVEEDGTVVFTIVRKKRKIKS